MTLECSRTGLRTNKGKTEVMGVTKCRERLPVKINMGGTSLKQVKSFKYLESLVCQDVRCDREIHKC